MDVRFIIVRSIANLGHLSMFSVCGKRAVVLKIIFSRLGPIEIMIITIMIIITAEMKPSGVN